MSSPRSRNAPSRNPTAAGIHGIMPSSSDMAMEGASSDQKLAAIITPAAKPSMTSRARREGWRARNTTAAPRAVTLHVNVVAISA